MIPRIPLIGLADPQMPVIAPAYPQLPVINPVQAPEAEAAEPEDEDILSPILL